MLNKTTATIILTIFCFAQTSFAAPYKAQNLRELNKAEQASAGGKQDPLVLALAGAGGQLVKSFEPVLAAA